MAEDQSGQSLLKNAYELATPRDNEAYYDSMAASYDADFAHGLGYGYPDAIAAHYHQHALDSDLPIADIGCGTGLVAQALKVPPSAIDGMDISPAMIDIATRKKLYRRLYQIDLTADVGPIDNDYGAVVSAGTFTHGHLGPEPLEVLLRIAATGALFVIGVNKAHYDARQFAPMIDSLLRKRLIVDVQTVETPIYSAPGHAHSDDVALVLLYRKTARSPA